MKSICCWRSIQVANCTTVCLFHFPSNWASIQVTNCFCLPSPLFIYLLPFTKLNSPVLENVHCGSFLCGSLCLVKSEIRKSAINTISIVLLRVFLAGEMKLCVFMCLPLLLYCLDQKDKGQLLYHITIISCYLMYSNCCQAAS